MDSVYLHLVTNHIPIIGVPFAIAILLAGFWRKSEDLKSLAMLAFVVLGAITVVVYLTGTGAEESVEHVPGVSEAAVESHEDFSIVALATVLLTALLSAIAFLITGGWSLFARGADRSNHGHRRVAWAAPVVLIAAFASAGTLVYSARLGGMIRHTEINASGPAAGGGEDEREEEDESRNRIVPSDDRAI